MTVTVLWRSEGRIALGTYHSSSVASTHGYSDSIFDLFKKVLTLPSPTMKNFARRNKSFKRGFLVAPSACSSLRYGIALRGRGLQK